MNYVSSLEKIRGQIGSLKLKKKKLKITDERFEHIVKLATKAFVDTDECIDRKVLAKRYNLNDSQSVKLTAKLREIRELKKTQSCIVSPYIVKELPIEIIKEISLEDHLARIRFIVEHERIGCVEQSKIKEGFVYLISNGVWDGWLKVGMTVDYEDRLKTYNVYDPNSNYRYSKISYVFDRKQYEKDLIELLNIEAEISKGEWFKIDKEKAISIFNRRINV